MMGRVREPAATPEQVRAAEAIRAALGDDALEWVETAEGVFDVVLPGDRKLKTPVRLEVGPHALAIHAFVCRRPDENHQVVYRWLLERNLRMFAVAFAVDQAGDIFLDSRLPLAGVTAEEVDRLLGSVLTYSDESFNTILELGFATAIRKEWEWRISRGEPTHNLAAFRGWLEKGPQQAAPPTP